jgi:NhaP-type Na+/H+ or K+/H+ antiporter
MFASFSELGQENIQTLDIVLGATSFLVVAFGGVIIGLFFGVLASATTKYTEKTPVLEPLIIVSYAYIAYLTAEMTSTSSILA